MSSPAPVKVVPARVGRRLWRWLAVAVLVVAVASVAVPWVARQVIGPDRLKAVVADALSDALGRKVTILGDVTIILVPWFGLAIGPLTVADDPPDAAAPMLRATRTEVTIRVLPLLAKVVSPGSIRARGLSLTLRRAASGRSNWEAFTAPGVRTASAPSGWQVALQPGGIRISEATVVYRDDRSGRAWTVTDAWLSTGRGQPFDFSVGFRLVGAEDLGNVVCHAQGRAALDPETGALAVLRAQTAVNWVYPKAVVPGGAFPVAVAGQASLRYDPAGRVLDLTDVRGKMPGVDLTGTARVLDPLGAPKAEASLTFSADMAGAWRDILGLSPGAAGSASLTAPSGAGGGGDRTGPSVARDEKLRAPGGGKAVLTVAASADSDRISLREARLALPGEGTASARGTFVFGQTPLLDLALAAEDVDFNALPRSVAPGPWIWPAETLARLVLDARLELRRCRLGESTLLDFHATARSRQGHARLYPVSARLPGGVASLDARLDAAKDGLAVDARAVVEPLGTENGPAAGPTRLRLLGRFGEAGTTGTLALRSPDPAAAGRVLGLSGLPATALEGKAAFAAPRSGLPPRRLELTGLEARVAGAVFRGQVSFNADAQPPVAFDLAAETLDADKLSALSGQGGDTSPIRAEGKLRVGRLALRGLDIQNLATGLGVSGAKVDAAITGADLFGGKLTGKIAAEPSGRVSATVQLAGAEAAKLPGAHHLSGAFSAKATLETTPAKAGHPWALQATADFESSRIALGQGADKLLVSSPKAVVQLTGRDIAAGAGDIPLEANLHLTCPAFGVLREVRFASQGPLVWEKAGHLKEGGPAKLEASALWRDALVRGRDLKLALSGPVTLDLAGGGFASGELRFDLGGLSGTTKIWRKAGDSGSTNFSLNTGQKVPRQVLAGWGVTLPKGLSPDRLAKASLTLSGTAGGAGLDIDRLRLVVDESTLSGRIGFPKYSFKHGKWDLSLDRLDWDAYIPPGPPSTAADRKKALDLRLLRELSLEGKLAIGWLKKGNVTFDAATITGSARGGVFTIRQESPRFYGGRFFGEVRGDARDVVLKTSVELKLEGFECARFLRDWAEGDTLDSGGATFVLAARTSGASEAELRANLSGNARLQITRGALKVRDSSPSAGKDHPRETIPFDVFSSSWTAREGVAHSEDFLIDSPRMQVRGKGAVDLRDETIDLSLLATLADGTQAPATIVGPLDNPKLTIDRNKMFGDMLYRILQGIVSIPGKAVTHILQLR